MVTIKSASIVLVVLSILNSAAGYLREVVVAASFGAGPVTDAFFSSYAFVMTLNDLLITASLTSSIIPAFRHIGDDIRKNQQLFSTAVIIVAAVSILLAIGVGTNLSHILPLLVPGLGTADIQKAIQLGGWLVWLLPMYGLYFLFSLTLNSRHHFIVPGIAWLAINVIFTLIVLGTAHRLAGWSLLIGVMSGPLLMTLLLGIIVIKKIGFRPSLFSLSSEPTQLAWHLSRPIAFTLGVGSTLGLLMLSHLIVRKYGSLGESGSVSALTYAFRIYEVPLTLAAHVAGTIVLPIVAGYYADRNWEKIAQLSQQLVFWGSILLIPAATLVYFEADTIVYLLLERGNFTTRDSLLTSEALKGFGPAIVFEAVFVVYYRIFYALHRPGIPIVVGLASLTTLLVVLETLGPNSGIREVALSLNAGFFVASIMLFFYIHRVVGNAVLPKLTEIVWIFISTACLVGGWHLIKANTENNIIVALSRMVFIPIGFWTLVFSFLPKKRHTLIDFFKHKKIMETA